MSISSIATFILKMQIKYIEMLNFFLYMKIILTGTYNQFLSLVYRI